MDSGAGFRAIASCALVAGVSALVGCSFLVNDLPEPPTSPTQLTLSPEPVRAGETATVRAEGSLDPNGGEVQYRFEWFRGSESAHVATDAVEDSFAGDFVKSEEWMVRATPIAANGREGQAKELSFVVANTAPTLRSVALSSYRPFADDRLRASPVGYDDVDGDANASRYIWRVGNRAEETTTPAFDLAALAPAEGEQLTLEVIPSDGETDNEEGAITLGPFDIDPLDSGWRVLRPNSFLGALNYDNFVAYDPRHRRFVIYTVMGDLWEYGLDSGFVLLHPDGDPPATSQFLTPIYDATPGKERLLVVRGSFAAQIDALHLEERGRERWEPIELSGGPETICGFSAYFDQSLQYLFFFGGFSGLCLVAAPPTDRLWVLDLSDPDNATWLTDGSLGRGITALYGGTVVKHPTENNTLLFFGGFTDGDFQQPAPVQAMRYDFSNAIPINFFDAGPPLRGDPPLAGSPRGVLAITDEAHGKVVGGLGGDAEFGIVDRVWVYTPGATGGLGTFLYPPTALFSKFDTSLGAVSGIGGWDGDRIVFWPGFISLLSMFRLGQINLDETGNYIWDSFLQRVVHYPVTFTQVAADGAEAVLNTGAPEQPMFRFDLKSREFFRDPHDPDDFPGARIGMNGGARSGGGLWLTGGTIVPTGNTDMQPWSYADGQWDELDLDEASPIPNPRRDHMLFDTGCGPAAPFGFFGGRLTPGLAPTDQTWILRCDPDGTACIWDLYGGPSPGNRFNAAIVNDGDGHVLLFGGWGFVSGVHVLELSDVCADSDAGWQLASADPDPPHGVPSGNSPSLVQISNVATAPEFLLVGGGVTTTVWNLKEIDGEADPPTYRWDWITEDPLNTEAQRTIWDADQARIVLFQPEGPSPNVIPLAEFRYRP